VLSLLQASIVNQNSNTTVVVGDGSVTNNNWVINIIRIFKAQVRSVIDACCNRTHPFIDRRKQ